MSQPAAPEGAVKQQQTSAAPHGAPANMPNPGRLFQTFFAYQQSAAMKAAIDLDIFTIIGDRHTSAAQISARAQASERGVRILCDYLTVLGFLTKMDLHYGLTPEAAIFLDRKSPACMGSVANFLCATEMLHAFDNLTEAVRKGGTMMGEEGTVSYDNPIWVEFARSMAPMMRMPAEFISQIVGADKGAKCRVLDIAAGHGLFGIDIARHNPQAEIVALDWPNVLEVAKENARKSGVESRYSTLPGSAFEVDLGSGYDLILLTNFLHHFNVPTNEGLLRRVHAALAPNGRVATLDFVPNDDRVTPAETATFSLVMLGSTAHGDAYTYAEFEQMFKNAGFSRSEHFRQPAGAESVIISHR
jgi:2-polyprenyl-3-methyl-5-hydroxy-6-metoxy-1,4-benzoquinol methylase